VPARPIHLIDFTQEKGAADQAGQSGFFGRLRIRYGACIGIAVAGSTMRQGRPDERMSVIRPAGDLTVALLACGL
jgi:hypothetical protein